jgi:hypothetical protein
VGPLEIRSGVTGAARYAVVSALVVVALLLLLTVHWTCTTTNTSTSCGITFDPSGLTNLLQPAPAPAPVPTTQPAPIMPTPRTGGGLKPLVLD